MKDTIAVAAAKIAPWLALFNGGTLTFYSGTEPADPDTALSGNTALATLTFSATAFGSVTDSAGLATATASFAASTVAVLSAATSGGTATTFARAFTSGAVAIGDFSVGTSGTDIVIGNTLLLFGASVTVSSFTLSQPYH